MLVEHPAVDQLRPFLACATSSMPARRCIARTRRRRWPSSARCWCSISGSARSPATSPCCRRRCTIPRTGRRRGSAPAATSAPACRSRSRTMTAASCKPFETGEICVIGPAVFAGYYDNPEANAKAFRDGWFRTGDLGHMDEEGFVYITGRASDMYISGGSNIYPREIEEKILTHPAIAEVAVVGVPDPVWGEIGVAVCVARERAPSAERGRDRRPSWPPEDRRATRCRSASSSGRRCRNPATARCRSGWCGTNSRRAGCSNCDAASGGSAKCDAAAIAAARARRRLSASSGSEAQGPRFRLHACSRACRCWRPRAAALPRPALPAAC